MVKSPLACNVEVPATQEHDAAMTEARTDPDLLYVGTYTESIYLVRIDRRSGELLRVGSVNAGANPSFLSITRTGGCSTP